MSKARLWAAAALVLACLALAACASRVDDDRFVDAQKRFKVSLPGPPKVERLGGDFQQESWAVKLDNIVFGVMRSELPPEPGVTEAQRLDAGVKELIRSLGGKMVYQQPINANGREGREAAVEYSGGRGMYRVRIFFDGDVLYQLVLTGGSDEVMSAGAMQFLESFEILKR